MNQKREFIVVIIIGIIIILAFWMASYNIAYAQDATETPTITPTVTQYIPYQLTQKSTQSISDVSCPEGNPIGYGTVTPSTLWLLYCEKCLIPTLPSLPTTTPTNTGTATNTPTGTLQPTATSTPTLTITPSNDELMNWGQMPNGIYTNKLLLPATFYAEKRSEAYVNQGVFRLFKENGIREIEFEITVQVKMDWQAWGWTKKYLRVKNNTGNDVLINTPWAGDLIFGEGTSSVQIGSGTECGSSGCLFNYDWTITVSGTSVLCETIGGCDYLWIEFYPYYQTSGSSQYVDWTVNAGDFNIPTPTPTTVSYCSVIDGQESDQDIFGYSGLVIGDANCIDIGPYEFSLLGLDIDIPQVMHLCLQELTFGYVAIFGLKISIDMLMIALTVIWVLYWLLA